MKKSLQLLCLAIALALIPAAILVAGDLPPDSGEFVQKKYAGWNGVLRGWISSRWEPGGSFNAWLNECAAEFEKEHEGVYLEFTQVEEAALAQLDTSGIRPPDLVFFSPGVMDDGAALQAVDAPANLLPDFIDENARCIPVAMGGYIWAVNRSICESAPDSPKQIITYPADEPGRYFSAALVALMSGGQDMPEAAIPDPGIDLGLPAISEAQTTDAWEAFINGELAYLPVTQKEIARLVRLQDSGKGPDWMCEPGGDYALADQLLYCGAVVTGSSEAEELAGEFTAYLCSDACQQRLANIGAFPVTGQQIYPTHSAYAELAALLQTRRLLIRNPFSEYSVRNFSGIVRDFKNGLIDAPVALRRMGLFPEG